ncbi:trypsin-like serine protease [Tepidiforma sp.]|uniref:trypsin-like serine peptidase n=1 Tax=Tepidiforma sp. TaxID=2682230 RepID=UPI002ADE3C53|nr:trypsin-like serine protease [Tepidiforma sp.]
MRRTPVASLLLAAALLGLATVLAASGDGPAAAGPPRGSGPGRVFHDDGHHPALVSPASRGDAGAAAVIGFDQRVRIQNTTVYPWSAIVYLELYDGLGQVEGTCSGTFISADAILTAAHCLYGEEGWTADIRVVPGKNGASEPLGFTWAADWWVPDPWYNDPGNDDWDWGLIRLDGTPGAVTGWLTIASLSTATLELPGIDPAIVGYPGDKPDGTMWFSYQPSFLAVEPFTLAYDIDTAPGQSGSAIILTGPAYPAIFGYIVGIHVRGGTGANEGTRIDPEVIADLDEGCRRMGCQFAYFVEPPPSATPTPTAPTPTSTASATPTLTPTPTAPAARGFRLLLPLVARD